MSPRRVVITGLGAISAAGEGAAPLWQSALEERSGVSVHEVDPGNPGAWRTAAGLVRDFDPEKFVTQRKTLKVMARDIQLAVAGAGLALDDAGAKQGFDPERFGLIVGSGVLDHELDELVSSVQSSMSEDGRLDMRKFGTEGLSALFPLWLLKYLPNMPACHISILFGLQGMNNTVTTGASAGLQAVGEAFHIIRRGDADRMLAGGAESKVNPVGLSHYRIFGCLPELAAKDAHRQYRPFDVESKGIWIGEAAAFVVLEELEHAKKRGARIYAEITGFGSAASGQHRLAMESALREAGSREVQYVQACGLGLPEEDRLEAEAIEAVFNGSGRNLSVSASKPLTGFSGFSSGALDLVIAAKAIEQQTVPPATHFSKAGRDWSFEIVRQSAQKKKIRHALVNSLGLKSPSVSALLRAPEGIV